MSSLALLLLCAASAAPGDAWLHPTGPREFAWGSTQMPVEFENRDRSEFLPDAGFIGAARGDKPQDIELPGPHPLGERRFIRYVQGRLVDAWIVRDGTVDPGHWGALGSAEWSGTVLGPAPDGWRAFGDATSWAGGGFTAMHWKDRATDLEILAVRSAGATTYKALRAQPLTDEAPPATAPGKLKGELKALVKAREKALSGCLNDAEKPIEANIRLRFDRTGRPSMVRVDTDKTAPNVVDCMAGVLADVAGPANDSVAGTLVRMR
jgi:hypothetical protein